MIAIGMNELNEKFGVSEVEETIMELEVYLERYPDDDIAQMQYMQYLAKRPRYGISA
ncbi:hypothetical protein ACFO9Q_00290 [Paenibacillus sp. GCM10023252]|uniref:hypothetical protein n=1 Tax=Paenibacillus sp. GCM10023252 TaxID=3252649 RepID=UPI00361F0AC2